MKNISKKKYIIIFVASAGRKESEKIADELLRCKAAACVSVINCINSYYLWKGRKQSSKESLIIIKAKSDNFITIKKIIKSIHSYELPEIIAMPIVKANKQYLKWIDNVTIS